MAVARRPGFQELAAALAPRVEPLIEPKSGWGGIEPLARLKEQRDLDVADGVTKFLVRGSQSQPAAVVLVASPVAPGLVARGMQRAREARDLLGAELGRVILPPLGEGEVFGLTYAVLPYCRPLATKRLLWWLQRRRLTPVVLVWLRRATEKSARAVPAERLEPDYARPLQLLAEDRDIDSELRDAAREALVRLKNGQWRPRRVLMHNDLWQGNILIDGYNVTGRADRPWPDRFVLIDWPGAAIDGYAFHDLLRFALAMRLHPTDLRRQILAHCDVLQCELVDARSYLVAALAYLAVHLEHFPKPAFVRTARSCWDALAGATA